MTKGFLIWLAPQGHNRSPTLSPHIPHRKAERPGIVFHKADYLQANEKTKSSTTPSNAPSAD